MKKKMIFVVILTLATVMLTGFFAGGRKISADVKEEVQKDDTACPMAGFWYLSRDTDYEMLNSNFPDVYAFGGEMEIRDDGLLNWYVGADGAAGTYTVRDNMILARVAGMGEYDEYDVVLTMTDDGEIKMIYKSVPLTWTRDM